MSIYADFPGVGRLPAGSVRTEFGHASCALSVADEAAGVLTTLQLPRLCHAIDGTASKCLVKPDRVVIKLRKRDRGQTWSDLDGTSDLKNAARQRRIQSGDLKNATTQELLADMYANSTDEDRRKLMEASYQGQLKREQQARDAAAD